jgi:hypothetical protein
LRRRTDSEHFDIARPNSSSRVIVLVASLLAALLTQSLPSAYAQTPTKNVAQSVAKSAAVKGTAQALLETLLVKGKAPKTGYSRSAFSHWRDPDRNGCDARNDILKRDLSNIEFKSETGKCKVVTGILNDPYSGMTINFTLGASEVDIDHVVALSHAWQTGAFKWSDSKRLEFANDPTNLLAVSARLNRQKGDSDAASWLPPAKSYRCAYVARQVVIKVKYGLWLTTAEKARIKKVLEGCPNYPAPTS